MPIPINKTLYEKARKMADKVYAHPSAYKSGYIVKTYKDMGGKYREDNKPKTLKRWFKEKWDDIGKQKYPVYRPFIRILKATPLTASEISPAQAKRQIALKQRYKWTRNLPKFIRKRKPTTTTRKKA